MSIVRRYKISCLLGITFNEQKYVDKANDILHKLTVRTKGKSDFYFLNELYMQIYKPDDPNENRIICSYCFYNMFFINNEYELLFKYLIERFVGFEVKPEIEIIYSHEIRQITEYINEV